MSADTKTTILDAAEALFGEQGFAATSLRQLTARAGVNLAAVHYHFGSKEELAKAVLLRRMAPIQAERRRRLDALPRAATLDAIVRAFVEPALLPPAGGGAADCAPAPAVGLCRVLGRISVEQPPFLRDFLGGQFRELGRRFADVLATAAPHLDPTTTWWRLHFVVGAMAHTLQNAHLLGPITGGLCAADEPRQIVEQLVAFARGGLAAPAAAPRSAAKPRARRRATGAKVHR